MSGRYPDAGSRGGAVPARHRWAATLGAAPDEGLLGPMPGSRNPTAVFPPVRGEANDDAGAAAGEAGVQGGAGFRWRTGRRAAALLAVVSVLLGGWFWWQAASGAPRVESIAQRAGADAGAGGEPGTGATAAPAATAPAGGTAAVIIVHVAGAVAKAGVVELPRGSRLHEAIKAAGGSTRTADLDRLNLAAVLEDGQKILVPERGSPDPVEPAGPSTTSGAGTANGSGESSGRVNLNTAGVEELTTLPRVGPVLAQRIVDWRKQHGRFGRVEELDAVDGVGPKMLAALLPLVRV